MYGPDGPAGEGWSPSEAAQLMYPEIEHRGRDATGWMYLDRFGHLKTFKIAKPAGQVLDEMHKDSDYGIPDDVFWWIGHVRLATHGHESNPHNNHPIVSGNIVGVHNGICYNYKDIFRREGIHREHAGTEVDSEAIFAAIDKYGVVEGLDELDALAAVAFVDKRNPDQVFLATTDANPCVVAHTKSGAHYFASEQGVLDALDLDLAEPIFILQDYQLFEITGGKNTKYVQYADPQAKIDAGLGWTGYSQYQYGGGWGSTTSATEANQQNWWDAIGYQCIICGWLGKDFLVDCPECGAPDDCLMEIDWDDKQEAKASEYNIHDDDDRYFTPPAQPGEGMDDWLKRVGDERAVWEHERLQRKVVTKEPNGASLAVEGGKVYYLIDGLVLTPAEYGAKLREGPLSDSQA